VPRPESNWKHWTYLEYPVRFRLESLDLIVPLDTEPQGRRLTRSVRDEGGVQISVFALEKFCLESREGATDPQVQLLSGVHRL